MRQKQTNHKKRYNQLGFSPIIIILIVVTILAAGFGVWYVWKSNQENDQNTQNQPNGNSQTEPDQEDYDDGVSDWDYVTTQDKTFSMRVPDGWTIVQYPGDYLGAFKTDYKAGTPAVVETSNTEYLGHSIRFRASVTPIDDAGLGPQWASPQVGLDEAVDDFYIGSLEGKKYKGIFSKDLDQTMYEYVFRLDESRKLDIVYVVDHEKGDSDEVEIVEQAIKTIEFKSE